MTKRQDLRLQRRSRPEQSDQRQPNQAANISHQPRASPNSPPLASRIEFPTMTLGRSFAAQFWAGCTTSMSGFDFPKLHGVSVSREIPSIGRLNKKRRDDLQV